MKGDFARVTFDPTRHYSQVFQQQGRVLLEADWNEQGRIQLHLLRTLAVQPYRPTPDYGVGTTTNGFENPPASYALYLDAWERHLSAVESPAIGDVALNGVDTCSRAQVVWQLRMLGQAQAAQQLDGITAALNVRLQAS